MGLSHTLLAAIVGGFIANLGGGFMMPTAITWLLQTMPAAYRGRGAGLWTASNFFGQFLSPLAILVLQKSSGSLEGALLGCGLASGAAAIAFGPAAVRSLAARTAAGPRRTTALLGASKDQIKAFHDYLEAFSAGDFARFPAYYADDIVFDLGVAAPFHSKAEVLAFYRGVFANIREQVTLEKMAATPDAIAASISVLFTAFNDAPTFVLKSLRAGESITGRFEVLYGLRDGLIATVKVAMVGEPH